MCSPIEQTPSGEVPPKRSKESLAFEITANTASTSFVQENEMLSQLIVEDLPNDGVKIVFMNQSGNVTVRIPKDSQTKTLVKNIHTKQWREAFNEILKHEEIEPELNKGITKLVSLEFDEYLKSGSILEVRKSGRARLFFE